MRVWTKSFAVEMKRKGQIREVFQGKNRFWYLIGYETRRKRR